MIWKSVFAPLAVANWTDISAFSPFLHFYLLFIPSLSCPLSYSLVRFLLPVSFPLYLSLALTSLCFCFVFFEQTALSLAICYLPCLFVCVFYSQTLSLCLSEPQKHTMKIWTFKGKRKAGLSLTSLATMNWCPSKRKRRWACVCCHVVLDSLDKWITLRDMKTFRGWGWC